MLDVTQAEVGRRLYHVHPRETGGARSEADAAGPRPGMRSLKEEEIVLLGTPAAVHVETHRPEEMGTGYIWHHGHGHGPEESFVWRGGQPGQ